MKKAVLILNMPSKCFNCPLHESLDAEEGEHEFMMFCKAEHWREPVTHTPIENLEERPSWCPLRSLPQAIAYEMTDTQTTKAVELIDNAFKLGWNTCLNVITGK